MYSCTCGLLSVANVLHCSICVCLLSLAEAMLQFPRNTNTFCVHVCVYVCACVCVVCVCVRGDVTYTKNRCHKEWDPKHIPKENMVLPGPNFRGNTVRPNMYTSRELCLREEADPIS